MCNEVTKTYYVKGVLNFPISFTNSFIAVVTHNGQGNTTSIINLLNNTSIGAQLGMPGVNTINLPWRVHYIAIGK